MAVTRTGRKHSSGIDGDYYFSIEITFNTTTDNALITGNFYISSDTKAEGGSGDAFSIKYAASLLPFNPAVHHSFDGYMDAVITAALDGTEGIVFNI
jgi:hypothetical protein